MFSHEIKSARIFSVPSLALLYEVRLFAECSIGGTLRPMKVSRKLCNTNSTSLCAE